MKYRKLPIVIEATQYQPGVVIEGVFVYRSYIDKDELRATPCNWDDEYGHRAPSREGIDAFIPTMEGWMHVSHGDYVITGVKGERYPCKPDIFEATYELVKDE